MAVEPQATEQQRQPPTPAPEMLARAFEAVRFVGNIRLMEAWTSDNPDAIFKNQTFEIRHGSSVARIGRDGRLCVTRSPRNITWFGGSPAQLERVVHVKIVSHGVILIDDAFCIQAAQPKEVPGGVSFDVMEV